MKKLILSLTLLGLLATPLLAQAPRLHPLLHLLPRRHRNRPKRLTRTSNNA